MLLLSTFTTSLQAFEALKFLEALRLKFRHHRCSRSVRKTSSKISQRKEKYFCKISKFQKKLNACGFPHKKVIPTKLGNFKRYKFYNNWELNNEMKSISTQCSEKISWYLSSNKNLHDSTTLDIKLVQRTDNL